VVVAAVEAVVLDKVGVCVDEGLEVGMDEVVVVEVEDAVVVEGVPVDVDVPPVHPLTRTKTTINNATSKPALCFMDITPYSPQRKESGLMDKYIMESYAG